MDGGGICGTGEVDAFIDGFHPFGSQSVVGASVHEVRKCVEGERGERKATEVVYFEM